MTKLLPPNDYLLDRAGASSEINRLLAPQLKMLETMVDFGTNAIVSTFHTTSEKRMTEIVAIAVLLKQVVKHLDAVHVLLSQGCDFEAAARALFEAHISLEWILYRDDSTEERAVYYYVASLRKERNWVLRVIPGTPEYERFSQAFQVLGDDIRDEIPHDLASLNLQLQEIDRILNQQEFATANQALQHAEQQRKFNWYSPLGVSSFRTMCQEVGKLDQYEVFYSAMSRSIHAHDLKGHVEFQAGGKLSFHPIRDLNHINKYISTCASWALSSYRTIIRRYRPGALDHFGKTYAEHWQQAMKSIPNITTEAGQTKQI